MIVSYTYSIDCFAKVLKKVRYAYNDYLGKCLGTNFATVEAAGRCNLW